MYCNLYGLTLALEFPPARAEHGACTTIEDLARYAKAGRIFSKWKAVNAIMEHSFERYAARGKGNRAKLRQWLIEAKRHERALAQVDAGTQRICELLRSEFEAHSDLEASREFGEENDAEILDQPQPSTESAG